MEIKIFSNNEAFEILKNDWERLQDQDPDILFYSSFEFLNNWWVIHKENKLMALYIITVYQDSKVVGIAPFIILTRTNKLVSYRMLKFMGRGDYFTILLDRSLKYFNILKSIFDYLNHATNDFDRIYLTNIKKNTALSGFILKNKELNKQCKIFVECPYLDKNSTSYSDFSKNFISTSSKKYANKLQREIGYTFEIMEGHHNKALLEEMMNLHITEQSMLNDSKNINNRQSLFNDRREFAFILDFYSKSKDVLTFQIKDKNGKILIYDTCYIFNNLLHSWNTGFNTRFQEYNLGRIMNYEMLTWFFNNEKFMVFDFGAGRYPWKYEWTSNSYTIYTLDLWINKTMMVDLTLKIKKIIDKIK